MGKHHSKEYKEYVVKLIVEEGRKTSEVSYELELSLKTVSRWVSDYKAKIRAGKSTENYLTLPNLKN